MFAILFEALLISGGKKKPININNFAGLSRKWVGVKLFMCFPFFPGEKGKHINKFPGNLRKRPGQSGTIPGQSRSNFVYVFSCLLVFSRPYSRRKSITLLVGGGGVKGHEICEQTFCEQIGVS